MSSSWRRCDTIPPWDLFQSRDTARYVSDFTCCRQYLIFIGTGLKQIGSQIICEIAGILKHKEPRRYWVEQDTRKVSLPLFPPFFATPLSNYVLWLVYSENWRPNNWNHRREDGGLLSCQYLQWLCCHFESSFL
jgi:hypothetical protein